MMEGRQGPLQGLRIIEVGHVLAGPYCGMLLADLGAEVIKVESPDGGDIGRSVGPHHVGPHNTYFASLNRGKKSVVLDLAGSAGRTAIEALVRGADGLITNLKPSAIRKLGLTYDSLSAVNPRIACVALTGYGLDGPFSDRPAFDYVIQALAGIMELTGDPGTPPVKTGYSVVDNSAGIMGALALISLIREGKGGQLDVSLYDTMLSQMNYIASAYLNGGEKPSRHPSGAHPYFVPAQIFETADGYLALFISHDDFWRRFAIELGRPDWAQDPRFATMRARAENRTIIVSEVAAALKGGTTDVWVSRLTPLGIVVAGVNTLDDALGSELTKARGMIASVPTPDGPIRLVASPIRIVGREVSYGPPPTLGQHTGEVLAQVEAAATRPAESPSGRDGSGQPVSAGEGSAPSPRASRRALSRALSGMADAAVADILEAVSAAPASPAWRIGITGPPGSGKSSLIARLAAKRVERLPGAGERLAVLAIDPSSPARGGAILGDRVRMDAIAGDPRVYMRSLASRGGRDGLAHNIVDILAVADAHGFQEVLLETVGVGQSEHAARDLVDSLVLVLHPEAGDSVQAMKSGIMELADIYVVNKADLPGAVRTATELRAVLKAAPGRDRRGWSPPVIEVGRDREDGLLALDAALEAHRAHVLSVSDRAAIETARRRYHLRSLAERRIDEVLADDAALSGADALPGRFGSLLAGLGARPGAA